MTDEKAFQIIRKHILAYDPSKARYPYGWMTAVIDAQKEIISEAVEKGSIGFAEWRDKNYKLYDDGRYLAIRNFAVALTSHNEPHHSVFHDIEQLYQEYLKSIEK